MAVYYDLHVKDDDLVLDIAGNPEIIEDRDVIAQDLIHMIREKGFLPPLVGSRNRDLIDRTKVEITLAVDNDYRVVPGTAKVIEKDLGLFLLQADTLEFGPVSFELEV
jgi:hypothetical protein